MVLNKFVYFLLDSNDSVTGGSSNKAKHRRCIFPAGQYIIFDCFSKQGRHRDFLSLFYFFGAGKFSCIPDKDIRVFHLDRQVLSHPCYLTQDRIKITCI